MKKVLDIATVWRELKAFPIAFFIAWFCFLPRMSAVQWIVDFKNKKGDSYITASDLAGYVSILNAASSIYKTGVNLAFLSLELEEVDQAQEVFLKSKESGVEHQRCNDNTPDCTIVVKNGILDAEEAKKLLKGVQAPFGVEFINCSGILDVNDDFRNHVTSLKFENCKFTMIKGCFTKALGLKVVRFRKTELTTVGNCLDHIFPEKVKMFSVDPTSSVSSRTMRLLDARAGAIKTYVDGTNFKEKSAEGELSLFEVSRSLAQNLKASENLAKQMRSSMQLEKELENEKSKRETAVSNIQRRLEESQRKNKKLREDLEECEQKIAALCERLCAMQNELTKTKDEKSKCDQKISVQEEAIKKLCTKNKNLSAYKNNIKQQVEDLKEQNSQATVMNSELKKENAKLEEKIYHQAQMVEQAKQALKQRKDLESKIERLEELLEQKGDTIEKLMKKNKEANKTIETDKKRWKLTVNWMKYTCDLICKLKATPGAKEILHEHSYRERIKKFKEALENAGEACNRGDKKKGQWIDFEEVFGQICYNSSSSSDDEQEEAKENDESNRRSEFPRRGRGFYQRGRGGYHPRGYRGGRGRSGSMMINRGRGSYGYH